MCVYVCMRVSVCVRVCVCVCVWTCVCVMVLQSIVNLWQAVFSFAMLCPKAVKCCQACVTCCWSVSNFVTFRGELWGDAKVVYIMCRCCDCVIKGLSLHPKLCSFSHSCVNNVVNIIQSIGVKVLTPWCTIRCPIHNKITSMLPNTLLKTFLADKCANAQAIALSPVGYARKSMVAKE